MEYTTFDYNCYFPKTVCFNNGYASGIDIENALKHFAVLGLTETSYNTVYQQELDKVAVNVTAKANGAQHGTAIRGNLWNYSTNGRGCAAIYGQAVGTLYGRWSVGVHGETKHLCTLNGVTAALSAEVCCFSEWGTPFGALINNTTGITGEKILGLPEKANPNAEGIRIMGSNWNIGINIKTICNRYVVIRDKQVVGERIAGFPSNLEFTRENWDKLIMALRTHGLIGD